MDNNQENQRGRNGNNGPDEKDRKTKRRIRLLWISFYTSMVLFILLVMGINYGFFGYMPSIAELENPQNALSSEVYGSDGVLLGRYYVKDRSNSKYTEISSNITNALKAAEDVRFEEHSGIDPIATAALP